MPNLFAVHVILDWEGHVHLSMDLCSVSRRSSAVWNLL